MKHHSSDFGFFICSTDFHQLSLLSKYFLWYFRFLIFWIFFPFNCGFIHFNIKSKTMWSKYRPPGCIWPVTVFSEWPAEAFTKNLQIWNLLKSMCGYIWIKCIFTRVIVMLFLCTILFYSFTLRSNQKVYDFRYSAFQLIWKTWQLLTRYRAWPRKF